MALIILKITNDLIEKSFRTGNIIDQCIISQGLPADAKLIDANVDHDLLTLRFETRSIVMNKEASLAVTKLRDV